MITIPELQKAFLELLQEIKDTEIKLSIGGGFVIHLKTEHIRKLGDTTLFEKWPEGLPY